MQVGNEAGRDMFLVALYLLYMRASVAALRRRLAGAILARTGRHCNCVGRSVSVMRRMVLLRCTSTTCGAPVAVW